MQRPPPGAAACTVVGPVAAPATGSWAREMTDNYADGGAGGGDPDPDWGFQNTLSARAVALSCGCFALPSAPPEAALGPAGAGSVGSAAAGPAAAAGVTAPAAPGPHLHAADELAAAAALASELGAMMSEVNVNMGDESDHRLAPFFAAAALGAQAAGGGSVGAGAGAAAGPEITESVVRRAAFGGALDPRYPLRIVPLPRPPAPDGIEAGWVRFRNEILKIDESYLENEPYWRGDGGGAKELVKWRAGYEWLLTHPALVPGSACLIAMHEPRWPPPAPAAAAAEGGEAAAEAAALARAVALGRPMGCIFPRIFAAMTKGGSLVGLAAVVVHT